MTKKKKDTQLPPNPASSDREVPDELRRRAEEVLERRRREGRGRADPEKQELERMVHELEVQQVELQMQQEDLRQARDRAEEQGRRFRNLFNLAPTAYIILGPKGKIKRANRAAAELLTSPAGQLAGRSFLRYLDLGDTAQVAAVFKQVLATHQRREVEARLHTTRERAVHVLITLDRGDPLLSEEPEVFASLTDITELAVSRDALDRQRREYRTLVDHLPEIVARFDREGKVHYINPAIEELIGIPAGECLGRSVGEADPSPGRKTFMEGLAQCFASNQDLEVCLSWPFAEQERHFRVRLVPEQVEDDGVTTVLAIAMDVTEETRLHRTLEASKKRAEQASRAKSAFLANMSHEIRTPISGILGMCGVLLKKEEEPGKALKLQMMRDAGQSLLSILNDILDLSRMEVGRFELHERVFSPRDMISKLQALFEPRVAQKGLGLEARVGPRVPDQLLGDPDRISQVLRNLVDNAVKFTSRGSVTVTVRADKDPAGTWALTFTVADTGPGVPREWQQRIFENFTQIETDYTRKHGGSGLGLALSKNLVDLMGGTLNVESKKNKGSRFSFTLPLQPPTREPLPEADEPRSMTRLRILLAEDNPITQLALQEGLSDAGHRVSSAYSGKQALEALEEESFDVVLMDVQMPTMDGLEATRNIRSSGRPYADIPIIGFTAYAHQDEQQKFLKAGMTRCVSKPIEEEDLLEVLGEVVGERMKDEGGRMSKKAGSKKLEAGGKSKKGGKRKK